jgi:hypothetical protein
MATLVTNGDIITFLVKVTIDLTVPWLQVLIFCCGYEKTSEAFHSMELSLFLWRKYRGVARVCYGNPS